MENYFKSKLKLFQRLSKTKTAIVNLDDPYTGRISSATSAKFITYGMSKDANLHPVQSEFSLQGIKVVLKYGETLIFETTDSSNNPVFEYIETNGNVNQTELIKYWVQSDTYSQSHAYRIVKKSVSDGLVRSDDGYLYIEDDEKDTEGMNPLTDKEKEKEKQNNDK